MNYLLDSIVLIHNWDKKLIYCYLFCSLLIKIFSLANVSFILVSLLLMPCVYLLFLCLGTNVAKVSY